MPSDTWKCGHVTDVLSGIYSYHYGEAPVWSSVLLNHRHHVFISLTGNLNRDDITLRVTQASLLCIYFSVCLKRGIVTSRWFSFCSAVSWHNATPKFNSQIILYYVKELKGVGCLSLF